MARALKSRRGSGAAAKQRMNTAGRTRRETTFRARGSCAPAPAETENSDRGVREMKRMRGIILGFGLVAAGLGLAASVASADDDVRLRLNWMYYGSHAGFAYGKDKGYYKDNGIDLDIRSGNGSGSAHRLVANGDSTFAYGSCASMVSLAAQGSPLISVAVIDAMGTDAILVRP
jgi:ABC-type nitrate/sulfonate/bicarbonate transport system substrate-binding protein